MTLYMRIELYREKLNKAGEKYGHNDPRVLALSKHLDKLIFKAMTEELPGRDN